MPGKPSAGAAECLRQAEECERLAARATDPAAKQSFLDVALRWRRIAETREFIESVERFLSSSFKATG